MCAPVCGRLHGVVPTNILLISFNIILALRYSLFTFPAPHSKIALQITIKRIIPHD